MSANLSTHKLRAGMIGMGMIFDDTYRPFFEHTHREGLFRRDFGLVDIELSAVGSRTGSRAEKYRKDAGGKIAAFVSFAGADATQRLLGHGVDAVCVATPDDRHFESARLAIEAGKHVLIEKPSVLTLQELDTLDQLARKQNVLAKIVYHKLGDPDHKKLRTHYVDGNLKHVNNGYCTLLEPKSISGSQFAEWIQGRNPGTYVAVHYIKLIDFTFGGARDEGQGATGGNSSPLAPRPWQLTRITCNGQRGIVGPVNGNTWDSVQLQVTYAYPDGREAAFDIHTSWVTPDNFPGYVDQEVQFRFDNGVWSAHQRKRGVEVTIENRTPGELKNTPNHHYNGSFLEPWGDRSQRGYGIEIIQKFFEEVAYVEHAGPPALRGERLSAMRGLTYNDVSADRNTVAIVQAMEALLDRQAKGEPAGVVEVNGPRGGLALLTPGRAEATVLYAPRV